MKLLAEKMKQESAGSSSPGTVCNKDCVARVMKVIQFRCVRSSKARMCTSSDRLALEDKAKCVHIILLGNIANGLWRETNNQR
jgi:hypothetical protein